MTASDSRKVQKTVFDVVQDPIPRDCKWAYSGSTYRFESGFGWICACKACDAQGEIGKTKAEAIRNWNRRVEKE